MYTTVYLALYKFAHFHVFGLFLCRVLAIVIPVFILWKSRIIASIALKLFSVVIAMLLYFLPNIVDLFSDILS